MFKHGCFNKYYYNHVKKSEKFILTPKISIYIFISVLMSAIKLHNEFGYNH